MSAPEQELGTEDGNARAERVEAGWSIGEDETDAPDAAVERAVEETFGVDRHADGWDVGRPRTKPEAETPVESPTGSSVAALGLDYDSMLGFLKEGDNLATLKEHGVIVDATTEAELRANATATELLRQRTESAATGRQTFADAVITDALERYESGEEEPQEIADELLQNFGQNAAAEFVRAWHAEEAAPRFRAVRAADACDGCADGTARRPQRRNGPRGCGLSPPGGP